VKINQEPILNTLWSGWSKPTPNPSKFWEIVSVSICIGATIYPPQSMINTNQLVRQSDQAIYAAKIAGKN